MTATKEYRVSKGRETTKNALLLRLERNQKDLMQLRNKLSSYRCEPRTYSLFERIETLRNAMDNLSSTNSEIISALKEHKRTVGEYVDQAKNQLSEFKRLNAGVEDYFTTCLRR